MGRILGLDVGERRIGIAISTPERTLAVPHSVLDARGDKQDAEAIAMIASSEGVDLLVVGHPISLDGTTGPQARRIEAFAQRLREVSHLPVELWDERLTSVQARRSQAAGARTRRGGRRAAPTDDIAAAIILQAYLDRLSTASP